MSSMRICPDFMGFTSPGALTPYRLVKFGASNTEVVPVTAKTDNWIGVVDENGLLAADATAGSRAQICVEATAFPIEAGGTVTRGQRLMADTSGRVVVSDGTGVVVGTALESGVVGDDIAVRLGF